MSIQDGVQVANKNELAIAFAQLENNNYKNGMLSFIQITISSLKDQQNNEQISIYELENEDVLKTKSIFCVQQISENFYVMCVIDKHFKLLNRATKEIKDISNPSNSINLNCLLKI